MCKVYVYLAQKYHGCTSTWCTNASYATVFVAETLIEGALLQP